nr:hypothetical protein GCM10020092_007690 [Actinoplanes digitatis]
MHEVQLELFEVAKAAVNQLAGSAGRAGGQVAGLDERHAQAARGGIQGGAGAGDPAADDEDVELLVAQPSQIGDAADRREPSAAYRETEGERTTPTLAPTCITPADEYGG